MASVRFTNDRCRDDGEIADIVKVVNLHGSTIWCGFIALVVGLDRLSSRWMPWGSLRLIGDLTCILIAAVKGGDCDFSRPSWHANSAYRRSSQCQQAVFGTGGTPQPYRKECNNRRYMVPYSFYCLQPLVEEPSQIDAHQPQIGAK